MKALFCLLIGSLLCLKGISQENPSPKQIAAMKNQAKKEAQELITDLEKQIADAKANGEDPESIKEMENQLVTLRRISGNLENVPTKPGPPKNIPKTKYPVVKYVSPIVPLIVKQPYKVPTETEANDRLLWYKGRKIDNTTLVTTAGMVVRYDPVQNRVIVRPEARKDTTITILVNKLSKTEKIKNEFAIRTNQVKNSFFMFPEIMAAYEEFDYIRKRYDKISSNTIDFPPNPIVLYSPPARMGLGGNGIMEPNATGVEEAYREFLDILNNPPTLDFPPPPKRPSDLCLCDPGRRAQYENELANWMAELWTYENELLAKMKNLHRYFVGNNRDPNALPGFFTNCDRALNLATSRKEQKVNTLFQNWGQDILREEALAMAKLTLERELQKMGKSNSSGSGSQQAFSRNYFLSRDNQFGRFIRNEMDAKNYNVVFDYSLYLNHEYHQQLLGGEPDVDITRYFNWQANLRHYNQFTMTIDLSFEVEWRGIDDDPSMIMNGTISSAPVKVSIGRMGCRWQLFQTNSNYLEGNELDFRIPLNVTGGVKRIKMQQIWNEYPYVGPRDILMVFPSVRFDFCPNGASDTAIMDVMRYKNDLFNQQVVNWNIMGSEELGDAVNRDPKLNYVEILVAANKLLIPAVKAKQRHAEMATIGNEMLNFNSSIRLDNPTGNPVLDELKIEYSSNLEQHKKQQKLNDAIHTKLSYILFDAVNNSDLLIEKNQQVEYDQPEIKEKMKRGSIIIKVIHTPSPQWQFGPDRI